jgi:hypothetical protein
MTGHRSLVLAGAGALVAFSMLAFSDPAVAEQLTGQVSAVDVSARKLFVNETKSGKDVTVAVGEATPITSTEGNALELKDLKKGDGVGITHASGVATQILVNVKPPEVRGQVSSVDPDAKTLVVSREDSDKDFTIKVDDDLPIATIAGKTLHLKDIKQGDGVGIVYRGDAPAKILVNAKPAELIGHVKSVGADLKSFIVTETRTKKDITVAVDDKTSVVTTEGKKLSLKELKKGDGVGIAHDASLASKIVVNVRPLE